MDQVIDSRPTTSKSILKCSKSIVSLEDVNEGAIYYFLRRLKSQLESGIGQ